jgi:monofunctional biosynthetic peptidoglycan transglycosylase
VTTRTAPWTGLEIVVDFAAGAEPWQSIDDAVMGGRSESAMTIDGGGAVFAGEVSLADGGGFASVRSAAAERDLSGFDGLVLWVRGDGRRYRFRIRTSHAFDGVSYQAGFSTEPGCWLDVHLPFSGFEPVMRGRRVAGHPPLDPARVTTFGLMVADRQEGPFRLEIQWIAGIRRECLRESPSAGEG